MAGFIISKLDAHKTYERAPICMVEKFVAIDYKATLDTRNHISHTIQTS